MEKEKGGSLIYAIISSIFTIGKKKKKFIYFIYSPLPNNNQQ